LPDFATSLPEYSEQQRQHQRNNDARGKREVEAESFALDVDVAGKMADAQLGQPRTDQPGHEVPVNHAGITQASPGPNSLVLPSASLMRMQP